MFNLAAESKTVVDIMMYGSMSEWSRVNSVDFAKALKQAEEDGFTQANLRINSPGGSIFEGLAMISAMKSSNLIIHAYIDGMAASMMSAVAINADKVFIAKGGRMMIHQGSGGVFGSAKKIKNYADLLHSLNTTIAELYAEKTGKLVKDIVDTWMAESNDQWFTSKQALKEKLVDEVVSSPVKAPEKAEATYLDMVAHYETQIENEDKMDKSKLIKRLGLEANATEEQIEAALTALEAKAKKNGAAATQKPEGGEGKASEKMVASFIKLGKKAGVVTEANESSMKKLAEADIDACMDLLPDPSAQAGTGTGDKDLRISELIAAIKGENYGGGKKTWNELTAQQREELEDKDPKAFEALFNAQYGNVENRR